MTCEFLQSDALEPKKFAEGENGPVVKQQQFLLAQVSTAGSVPTQTLLVRPSFAIPIQGNNKLTTILTVLKSVDSPQATPRPSAATGR